MNHLGDIFTAILWRVAILAAAGLILIHAAGCQYTEITVYAPQVGAGNVRATRIEAADARAQTTDVTTDADVSLPALP